MPAKYANYDYCFLKNGKQIFAQSESSQVFGRKLAKKILKKWKPSQIYYHFRKGGHVSAVKAHAKNKYFIKLDIKNFFPSVTRNKVIRDLVRIGFKFRDADEYAKISTVIVNDRAIIPFGFVQSSILSTLAFHKSKIGIYLDALSKNSDFKISVYVDDIIISSNSEDKLSKVLTDFKEKIDSSQFSLNTKKSSKKVKIKICAFNIDLRKKMIKINKKTIEEFKHKSSHNDATKRALVGYIKTINPEQAKKFKLEVN